jgi:limonene-1,2-epoxide hydrolase
MINVDDLEAIRQLKARYFRTLDTKDWAAMRQVFTDDVVMDTSAAGGTRIVGAEEFIAFLRGVIGDVTTVQLR